VRLLGSGEMAIVRERKDVVIGECGELASEGT
jgi:hypothetical protein